MARAMYFKIFGLFMIFSILSIMVHADFCTDLKHYYTFDGANAEDSIGSRDGVINGATNITSALCANNGCYDFDGSNDFIDLGKFDEVNSFTICWWMVPDNVVNYQNFFHTHYLTNDQGIRIEEYNTANLRLSFSPTDSYNQVTIYSSGQFLSDAKSQFCMSYNNNTANLSIYVNATNAVNSNQASYPHSWLNTSLGRGWYGSGSSRFWDGAMDEVMYWNRTLSNVEIGLLYNSGNGNFTLDTACVGGAPPAGQPVLTLNTSLINNTVNYNDNKILLNWSGTVTENGYDVFNCTVWMTNTTVFEVKSNVNISSGFQSLFNFGDTAGNFVFGANCSNGFGINDSDRGYFYKVDTESPQAYIWSDYDNSIEFLNGSSYQKDDSLAVDLEMVDTNLYAWNFTIKSKIGDVVYNLFEQEIVDEWVLNTTAYLMDTEGNYTMELTVWDSHTSNKPKPLDFQYQDELILAEDLSIYSPGMKIYNNKNRLVSYFYLAEDRYKFKVTWDDQAYQHSFILSASSLDYVENSDYQGHFVWKMMHWIDFEGNNVKNVEVIKIGENSYEVTVYHITATDEVEFESIGSLNVASIGYSFTVSDPQTILFEQILEMNTNIFTELRGGLYMIALVFLLIVFIILALVLRTPAILSLDGLVFGLMALQQGQVYLDNGETFFKASVLAYLFLAIAFFILGVALQIIKNRGSKEDMYSRIKY